MEKARLAYLTIPIHWSNTFFLLVVGTMNGNDIDKWSEKHVGSLALTRTIVGFVNVILSVIVVAKLFGWI